MIVWDNIELFDIDKLTKPRTSKLSDTDTDSDTLLTSIELRLAFECAGEYEGIFVFCLTAASGTTISSLLNYIANILWNIDMHPMINELFVDHRANIVYDFVC